MSDSSLNKRVEAPESRQGKAGQPSRIGLAISLTAALLLALTAFGYPTAYGQATPGQAAQELSSAIDSVVADALTAIPGDLPGMPDESFKQLGMASWGTEHQGTRVYSVAVASDGTVYAAIGTQGSDLSKADVVLFQYSPDLIVQATIIWEDQAIDSTVIAVAPDDSVYVLRATASERLIVHYSPQLDELERIACGEDKFGSLAVSANGSVYAAGSRGGHAAVVCFSPGLQEIASTTLDPSDCGYYSDLVIAPDCLVYASGTWVARSVVVRLSSELEEEKVAMFDGFGISALGAAPNSTVYVAGDVYKSGNQAGARVMHLGADLEEIASTELGTGDHDTVRSLLVDSDGNVTLVGHWGNTDGSSSSIACFDHGFGELGRGSRGQIAFEQLALAPDGTVYAAGFDNNSAVIVHYAIR